MTLANRYLFFGWQCDDDVKFEAMMSPCESIHLNDHLALSRMKAPTVSITRHRPYLLINPNREIPYLHGKINRNVYARLNKK